MRILLAAVLLVLSVGCERPPLCVPVPEDSTGEPRQTYDEFTKTAWLTSWFVFTPDAVWGVDDPQSEGRQWSVELWLRGNSRSPLVEITLRPRCARTTDEEPDKCLNCDDICSPRSAFMEILADDHIVNVPRARYQREPIGSPTPESATTWASSLSLAVDPRALWPLMQARDVKFRVCQAFTVAMSEEQRIALQSYLRRQSTLFVAPR